MAGLMQMVKDLGYSAPMRPVALAIGGMKCAGCVNCVERALLAVPGVISASVNIATERAGVVAVADPIKETAPAAISAWSRMGLRIALITGDSQRAAEAIIRRLGIDEMIPEVLSSRKMDAVRDLKSRHGRLGFVSDGINDAPALAEAYVGLAIGTGTDVAIEAADVVLISGVLSSVPKAIALFKATIRNIKQNLFWAFAYNVALVPIAAGVLYPGFRILLSPVFAAEARALSSVFVLGNALCLRGWRPGAGTAS